MNTAWRRQDNSADLLSITIAVLWLGCASVAVAGLMLQYPQTRPRAVEPPPVQARFVNVALAPDPPAALKVAPVLGSPREAQIADLSPPAPAAPASPTLASAPPLARVAAPGPAIAFSLPVEGLVRVVDAGQADHGRPAQTVTSLAPSVPGSTGGGGGSAHGSAAGKATSAVAAPVRLTFGEGEGDQPAPDYPRDAVMGHQEGTVTLRFAVGADGRVGQVKVVEPCRFPLLNQAAARVIRERWRFSPGAARSYEVPIEFQLQHSQ